MSTHYLDFELGNDQRNLITGVVFTQSGTGVLGTKVGHGLVTGDVRLTFNLQGNSAHYSNATWTITRINDDTFTLDGALWASFVWYDQTGDMCSVGGTSWATAWKTLTLGATASRVNAGDTVRIAKTDDPAAFGQDFQWTNGLSVVNTGQKVASCSAYTDWITAPSAGMGSTTTGFPDTTDGAVGFYCYTNTAFTTGPFVCRNLPTPLDLTGHTKISLWMQTSVALTAGDWSFALYSGSFGAVKPGVVFSNPSGTTVRGSYTNHGMATGTVINVTGCTQAYANATWTITNTGASTFTLDGAVWASFTGADVIGDCWIQIAGGPTLLSTMTPTWTTTDVINMLEYIIDIPDPSVLGAVTACAFIMNQDRAAITFYISAIRAFPIPAGILPLTTLDTRDLALWTAAANQTLTLVNVQRQSGGIQCTSGSSFTTGVACYKDFASGQDWSSYKYVSMLLYTDRAMAAGDFQLVIDDTVACASPLETINGTICSAYIPQWITFRIVTPANLTSVRSIGFKWTVDPGTNYFRIDSLFLSTGFTGDCVIANSATPSAWYGIARYTGSCWMVMGYGGLTGIGTKIYAYATNETSAGYYRKTLSLGNLPAGTNKFQKSGTAGNQITYSGGWNPTDSAHDGETWIGTGTYAGYILEAVPTQMSYITIEGIATLGGYYPWYFTSIMDHCIFDIPYIGWGQAIQFGGSAGCHENTITIDILQDSVAQFGPSSSNPTDYSIVINHVREVQHSSYAMTFYGFNCDITIGDILGCYSFAAINVGTANSRFTIGSFSAQSTSTGSFLNIADAQDNEITITGDVIGSVGTTTLYGIYLTQAAGNIVNFTKAAAVMQGFTVGVYVGNQYGAAGNKIIGVELKLNAADCNISARSCSVILDWVKLSSTNKIVFGANTINSKLFCHHYNQTLDTHRVYFGNSAGYTNTGPYFTRDTANAESGDCIDVNFAATGETTIPIGWVRLTAGITNTITLRIKKDSGFAGLVPGLWIEGLSYLARSGTALTTSYQTYPVASFVPARSQLAKVMVAVEGTAGHLYIDSIAVT